MPKPGQREMVPRGEPVFPHRYISTACYHKVHEECRRQCKFCSNLCECGCHVAGT